MKRGLVIAGGGAKGAYSFGCLESLRDHEIEFHAVAGTSSGALNAAIWSSGNLARGRLLWSNLSPSTSYRHAGLLRYLPRPLSNLLAVPVLFLALLATRERDQSLMFLPRWVTLIVDFLLCSGLTAVLSIVVARVFPESLWLSYGFPALLGLFLLLSRQGIIGHYAPRLAFLSGAVLVGSAAIFAPYEPELHRLKALYPSDDVRYYLVGALFVAGLVLAMLALFVCIVVAWMLMGWLISRLTVFSRTPLEGVLREFLSTETLKIPTYVTLAEHKAIFDPSDPMLRVDGLTWVPRKSYVWRPCYEDISDDNPDMQVKLLTASAALPLGIVSSVRIGDRSFVDGGVADNAPIFPLIKHDLDEIWILSLDNYAPDPDMSVSEFRRCGELARILVLARRDPPPETWDGLTPKEPEPGTTYWACQPENWPHLTRFHPASDLGGQLKMLDFSPEFAAECIAAGISDMDRYLSAKGFSKR